MRHNTLRLLACAMAIGVAATSFDARAATVTVNAVLITNSAITLTKTNDMDFGEWLMLDGTADSTLLLAPGGGVTATAGAGATVVEITASANAGGLTLQTPGAAAVNFYGSITTQIPDAGLTLGSLTYNLNGGASTALPNASGTTITTTGGANDVIGLGGTITMSDTPADATHTGVILITAEY